MRMLLKVQIPAEFGSAAAKGGAMRETIRNFMETAKPEAVYFALDEGKRTMFAVVDMADSSDLPRIGEPLFANLGANLQATPCMNADELRKGLEAAGIA